MSEVPSSARIKGRNIRCEYEDDAGDRCPARATSVDHFTPQSIAPLLGWTPEQTNAPANLQYLCQEHHTAKDRDTGARKELLRHQLAGRRNVKFLEHDQALQEIADVQRADMIRRANIEKELRRAAVRAGRGRLRRAS